MNVKRSISFFVSRICLPSRSITSSQSSKDPSRSLGADYGREGCPLSLVPMRSARRSALQGEKVHDMALWAATDGVELRFIEPGKPIQNTFVEAFNGRFLNECLSQHWFTSSCARPRCDRELALLLQRAAVAQRARLC